jgi:inner membrane protein YidH
MNEERDVTRRTHLAAERTWLAWWRTGLAVIAVAIGIGRITPALVKSGTVAYAVLGAGYALLAIGTFFVGFRRYRRMRKALEEGGYYELDPGVVAGFVLVGTTLAIMTLVLIVVQS